MKKKILIIGYGSIGQKHANIFKKLNCEIRIISSQKKIKFKKINYNQIEEYKPDISIISSTTNNHFKDLKRIDNKLKNKIILVEKPLFNKNIKYLSKKNKILVAYNLRFLPILKYIKKICEGKKPLNCDIKCFSFLPNWRKRSYFLTSSAQKKLGGGVLNDLSHEIDICLLLFPKFKVDALYKKKISNLKIDTEDFAFIIGRIKETLITINLSYFSKIEQRRVILEYKNLSVDADILNNVCYIKKNNKIKKIKFKNVNTYLLQAKNLIKNKLSEFCSLNDAMKVLKIIHR